MADTFFDQEENKQSHGSSLDFKRVLARAIRFWYVIILSLTASLVIAFYQTRYSERVYPVTASIVIGRLRKPEELNCFIKIRSLIRIGII
jgi:hypothetical protein